MSEIITDYTKEATLDTLTSDVFSTYRLVHYMADALLNFLSDSSNIKDERIHTILATKKEGEFGDVVTVAPAFREDSRESCTVPSIRVAAADVTKLAPIIPDHALASAPYISGWKPAGALVVPLATGLQLNIITEKYVESLLFGDALFELLVLNAKALAQDCGCIDMLTVEKLSAPAPVERAAVGNAKQVFQRTIELSATTNICSVVDTQGPVFRGISLKNE